MNREIDYAPFPYQTEFHSDPVRFKCVVGGRRVGKSRCALMEAIRACLEQPNQLVWWISPTYRDAREVGYAGFMEYYEDLKPAIVNIHTTYLRISFVNGSELYFKGSDNFDSLRGRGLNLAVLDEAAFQHPDTWRKVIRPALTDKGGRAILVTTPNGRNWMHEQYKYAERKDQKNWKRYHWPTSNNPLISEEDLEEARESLSSVDYQQEYQAEFVTKAGAVYSDFSDSNIIDSFTVDPNLHEVSISMDFGYASITAAAFMAYDHLSGNVVQFDELYVSRCSMDKIIDMISEKLSKHGLKRSQIRHIYTDPAGNAEELSSGISPVDMLRKERFVVVNKGTRIAPGLALLRAFIKTAKGNRRFRVTKECKESIRSLEGYQYRLVQDQVTEEPSKDGIHDHACDAIRYYFVNRFDNAKFVANELDSFNYMKKKQQGMKIKKCGACRLPFLSETDKFTAPFNCKECNDAND